MGVPWSTGEDARQGRRVYDFRPLRGVIVDLLVRPRRQEAGEGMNNGQFTRKSQAARLRNLPEMHYKQQG